MISNKEAINALGFLNLWGFTPAINVFKGADNADPETREDEINVLMSETGGDARHIMKSISDLMPMADERKNPINIYLHEPQKENLARTILFLTLFCETGMSERERMEIYLDIFGNCLIRDKTSQYMQDINRELIQLVTEDDKCTSVIKDLINFETLKFKDRDDIEDIFSSYHIKHPFDIEQLRDTRIRAHYKERYDYRRNLVDWDYQFGIKDFTKTVNQQEYRAWRLNGIAFETRLATGTIPNRTMGSYVDGKTVSCF